MKVRIIRQPQGTVSGVALNSYRCGEVYDIPPTLAEYLVLEQFAILEMRDAAREGSAAVAVERRRKR